MKNKVLILFPLLFLISCGPEEQSNTFEMTVGGTGVPNTIGTQHFSEFKQSVEEGLPNAKVKMLVFGQLGSEENIVSGLRRDRVQFANLSAIITSTLIPETALLYAPFLFNDEKEADFIFDNYLTDFYKELLAEKGLEFIAWSEIGFHNIYGKEPIILPKDAIGKRYRVSASLSSRYFAEAIGADLIPMGYGEIVQSLQTGLIEAGDNSIALYVKTGKEQEAPHYTLTRHSLGMSLMVARKAWWDKLSKEEQKVIAEAWPKVSIARKELRAEAKEDLGNAEKMGIIVHTLKSEQRALWKQASQGQTERMAETIGGRSQDLLNLIKRGKTEYQIQFTE